MTKCWIKTDFVPEYSKDYITENKWYEVRLANNFGGWMFCDDGEEMYVRLAGCAHLNGECWQVHYGEMPPDLPVKESQDVTKEVVGLLDNILDIVSERSLGKELQDLLDKLKSGEYSVVCNTKTN